MDRGSECTSHQCRARFKSPGVQEREYTPRTWMFLVVWTTGVLVYSNGLTGDFVHDDISAITTNPDVLGTSTVSQVFFNDFWGRSLWDSLSHKSYRPLTTLTFRFNRFMLGFTPVWFHLVNVLLHCCVCTLLLLLLQQLHLQHSTVLSAVLIFTTHPVHTEAVTGVVGRADLLACITYLAAIIVYNRAIERHYRNMEAEGDEGEDEGSAKEWNGRRVTLVADPGTAGRAMWSATRRRMTGIVPEGIGVGEEDEGRRGGRGGGGGEWVLVGRTGVLAGVGTMCKEHALTVLLVCAAWDIILHRRSLCRLSARRPLQPLFRRLFCLSAMGVVILLLRLWMLRGSSPVFSDQDNPASFSPSLLTRTLTFWYLPVLNVWVMLYPWRLSHDWQLGSIPLITSLHDARNIASLVFYASLFLLLRAGALAKGSDSRAVLLGLSLLVFSFLPATNLFFPVGFVMAERILYVPSLGYSLLMGVGVSRVGRVRAPCLLLLLLMFSCRTLHRNTDWNTRETLFLAGLRTLPHNAKMHYNFANLQKDLGNLERAKFHYRKAIRLWPGHWSAHNNLGTLLINTSLAERHFQLALKVHPQHSHAYYNLATLRQKEGRVAEAMALLEECLRYDTTNRDAVSVLSGLYVDAGRLQDAHRLYVALVVARASDPVVHNNYAAFLHRIGHLETALRHYKLALSLDPHQWVALVNTARLMTTLNRHHQAIALYKRALAIVWEAEVGESLGKLYLSTGSLQDAEVVFTIVLKHDPNMLSSVVCLARVNFQQRNYQQSEQLLRQVLLQDPGHQEALLQLSLLYAHTNRTHDALLLAYQAAHNCSRPPTFCAHLHAHHADLLTDRHSTEEAAQSYLLAVELEPTLTHAHVNLGALYHTQGDYGRAWRHYLTAHGQEPSNSLLLENMEKLRRTQQLQHPSGVPHCLNKS